MNIRNVCMILGAAAFMGTVLQAQPPHEKKFGTPEERREAMKKKMAEIVEKLNLTADQQALFQAKQEEMRESAEAVMKDDSLSRREKRKKMKELLEVHRAGMAEFLTDEQLAILDEMKSDRKSRMEMFRENRDAPPQE